MSRILSIENKVLALHTAQSIELYLLLIFLLLVIATSLLGYGVFILYRFHCDWLAYEEYEYEDDPDPEEKEPREDLSPSVLRIHG